MSSFFFWQTHHYRWPSISNLMIQPNFMVLFISCFSLQEFVSGLSILARGTVNEKLNWAFNLYDINGDGYITREVSQRFIICYLDFFFGCSWEVFWILFLFFENEFFLSLFDYFEYLFWIFTCSKWTLKDWISCDCLLKIIEKIH